ncbi:pilin [bacterium]|nr:pilin [bacterium]MCI0565722.1 pilin [bacterium]MCI0679854.1 pilin [bacterium]
MKSALFFTTCLVLAVPLFVSAQVTITCPDGSTVQLPEVCPPTTAPGDPAEPTAFDGFENPLKDIGSWPEFIEAALRIVVLIGIPLGTVFIIWAGLTFVTAAGSEEKIKQARGAFTWAVIGMALVLGAWGLSLVIENTIQTLQ